VTTLSTDTLFAFGKSSLDDLQPGGIAELDKLIAEAKKTPPKTVEITGYTDQIGSDAVNIPLSLARANTIKAYLEKNGFPSVPITTIGAGAKEPKVELGSCPSSGTEQKDCLAKNRRVTIKLSY
jgi:outer membrane protein OmpA-like peptidoglycan-associated protein